MLDISMSLLVCHCTYLYCTVTVIFVTHQVSNTGELEWPQLDCLWFLEFDGVSCFTTDTSKQFSSYRMCQRMMSHIKQLQPTRFGAANAKLTLSTNILHCVFHANMCTTAPL